MPDTDETNYNAELLDLELPEADTWEQREAEAALWQYAAGLDLAATLGQDRGEALSDELERVNDLLFLRDEIEDVILMKSFSFFENISQQTPQLDTSDDRLRRLASTHKPFMLFLLEEYQLFRREIDPERSAWWWWMDD